MSATLPTLPDGFASLAEIAPSCLAAIGIEGYENSLGLPPMRMVVNAVVDGLGMHNLERGYGHAPFLRSLRDSTTALRTVFPSTTAAALASLCCGAEPGLHGLTGYRVRDPRTGDVINQLNGWDAAHPHEGWCQLPTVYEQGAAVGYRSAVVGHARFAGSALTQMIHRGAEYHSANKLTERAEAMVKLVNGGEHQGFLIYFSELDEIAHQQGVESSPWFERLEEVDAAVRLLAAGLPHDVGLLVTADHGVVDISHDKHLLVCATEETTEGIDAIGGEPRCLQLYLSAGHRLEDVAMRWQHELGDKARVLTREEVIQAGLYGEISAQVLPRLGDLFVFAADGYALYDARDPKQAGRLMHGQHGGLSPGEMIIPLVRAGAAI